MLLIFVISIPKPYSSSLVRRHHHSLSEKKLQKTRSLTNFQHILVKQNPISLFLGRKFVLGLSSLKRRGAAWPLAVDQQNEFLPLALVIRLWDLSWRCISISLLLEMREMRLGPSETLFVSNSWSSRYVCYDFGGVELLLTLPSRRVSQVAAFIFIELVLFPLGCGIVLDLCTVWLFPEANLQSRIAFFAQAPLTAMFYHWIAGTMFMYVQFPFLG